MAKDYKIYGLIDPITSQLRYVGQTIKSLNVRLASHRSEKTSNKKNQWIASLKNKKCCPEIILIDTATNKNEIDELEIFYIEYFKYIGCKLQNMTPGGFGGGSTKQSAETISKRVSKLKGQKRTLEVKKKLSDIAKKRPRSHYENSITASKKKGMPREAIDAATQKRLNRTPEEKEYFANALRERSRTRVRTPEEREKLRNRKQCLFRSQEAKDKTSATMMGRKYSKERIQKRLDTIKLNKLNGKYKKA